MIGCEWPECAVPEKHRAECEDRECGGCRPRPSERGRLCAKHWAWLNRDLSVCAELVLQVRESMVRGPAAVDGDRVRGGKTAPPAPLDVAAVDAADELFALLFSAAVQMSSELGVAEPPDEGKWRVASVVHGVPSTFTPEAAARSVGRLVSWWRDHLEAIAGLPDVLDVGPELHEMVRVMRSRWPAAERSRHLPGTPCRECDLMDLWWTPPNGVGWPITVECHSCGYVAPEEDLTRLTHLVEFEQSKRKRKARA